MFRLSAHYSLKRFRHVCTKGSQMFSTTECQLKNSNFTVTDFVTIRLL